MESGLDGCSSWQLAQGGDLEVAARVPLGKLQVAFEVGGAKAGRPGALQARSGGR